MRERPLVFGLSQLLVFEVKATNGDTFLGGEDFDLRIIDYLADEFKNSDGIDLREDKLAASACGIPATAGPPPSEDVTPLPPLPATPDPGAARTGLVRAGGLTSKSSWFVAPLGGCIAIRCVIGWFYLYSLRHRAVVSLFVAPLGG